MNESTLPPEIRMLPIARRVALAEQIWASVVEDEDRFELTDAQKTELQQRIARHEADPTRVIPWEVAKRRLLEE